MVFDTKMFSDGTKIFGEAKEINHVATANGIVTIWNKDSVIALDGSDGELSFSLDKTQTL